ncbi:MAG TPA: methylated-DNA--[protein]-cysteine S-methyltransferase [Armatimonadota bacterium]|jgi:O-6-methylguanine DNA methyltransferase
MVSGGIVETPWGRLGIVLSAWGLQRVTFHAPPGARLSGPWADAFAAYLAGQPFSPSLPVDLTALPPFTQRVLCACRDVPFGAAASYAELAQVLGCPRGARAVGQALARNPVPVVIPCHRVLGAHGQLTGFLGGLDWKRHLLTHEGALPLPT